MILKYLMKPKMKKWILVGFIGAIISSFTVAELIFKSNSSFDKKAMLVFTILLGLIIMYISLSEIFKSIRKQKIELVLDDDDVEDLIDEDRLLVNGPKLVVIGGGTGLSTMLRGLKYYTNNITAIVTVGDDGGGSGKIREDFGMLPPGDIRNCILALADTEPIMESLLQYRFAEGTLEGQSFGNLFLAAMAGISENFEEAVRKMSSVLAVTGRVLPVTLDDMKLVAKLENGEIIEGESRIPGEALRQKSKIKDLNIEPKNAVPLIEALEAIQDADAIIMGPGSLYTSIIPNLLVTDIAEEVCKSKAIKIYVSNVMTQPGETDGFKVSDHIKTLIEYGGNNLVQYVIANNGVIPEDIRERYILEGSDIVMLDRKDTENLGVGVIEADLVKIAKGYVKHDSKYLAEVLMTMIMDKKLMYDDRKILEYMHISQKIFEEKESN